MEGVFFAIISYVYMLFHQVCCGFKHELKYHLKLSIYALVLFSYPYFIRCWWCIPFNSGPRHEIWLTLSLPTVTESQQKPCSSSCSLPEPEALVAFFKKKNWTSLSFAGLDSIVVLAPFIKRPKNTLSQTKNNEVRNPAKIWS